MRVVRGIVMAAAVAGAAALGACGKAGTPAGRASPPDTAKWGGFYVSDSLPGANHTRIVRLAIGPDTTAAISIEFVGLGTTYHPGRWTARGNELTMQPTRADGTPNELPLTWRLDGTRLVPLTWDRNIYGERGVTLSKQAPPARPPTDSAGGARR